MQTAKIGVISLGCSKNRVDTELMLERLAAAGYGFVSAPEEADIILINTCGFIESAKEEAIETILEMAAYKEAGQVKGIVVSGCLSGRYQEELVKELPEVDAFLGITAQNDVVEAVGAVSRGEKYTKFLAEADITGDYENRMLTTAPAYAYVKIAEGCNNRCAYCAIPLIRGNLKSRKKEEIVAEVKALLARGISEIVLVAQDTTKYGEDLYGKSEIVALIHALAPLPGLKWLRLLYCYPDGITQELLETMCAYDTVVKYIDMPVQHTNDEILFAMHRKNTRASTFAAAEKIRKASGDFILRSTVIVGFPGETEAAFEALKEDIKRLSFDRLGVFSYSREEGTPASEMTGQIDEETKEARRMEIMLLQQEMAKNKNKARIGKQYDTIIEGQIEEDLYYGRTYAEAPEVDDTIFVKSAQPLCLGAYKTVIIEDADAYELYGRIVE